MDRSNDSVRKIAPDGTVTTLAGVPQFVGSADGKGATAQFYEPEELAVDPAGNIYVVEHANNTVRKIAPVGTSGTNYVVTTLAGCATCAAGTNDGPGLQARFDGPFGLTRDKAGNIFVADTGNKTVRKLTQTDSGWVVSTFAGIPKVPGFANGPGTTATLGGPLSLAADANDNLLICDGEQIRKIAPDGTVSFVAGGLTLGTTDGPGASALFSLVRGITLDAQGNIFVCDSPNNRIRKLTPSGGSYNVTTLAGGDSTGIADGVGASARFFQPTGIAVDTDGNLYVVDSQNVRVSKGSDPAKQQNPDITFDTASGSISHSGNTFTFKVSTTATGSLVVEASSDLLNWAPVQTNLLSGAAIDLTVPFQAALNSFFRLRLTQ
jgi:sugar lactone lactonase YvrE